VHPIKSYLSILNPKVLYLLYLKCSISKSIVTDKETQNSPVTDCSISIAVSLLLESDCSISMPIKFYGDRTIFDWKHEWRRGDRTIYDWEYACCRQ